MMAVINRLSWLLLAFVAVTGTTTLVVVGGAALLVHWSLPLPQTWLLISAAAVYLLVHDAQGAPATAPPLPPPPEPEVPLDDLEHLRRLWQHGDISESTYRRAVAQATRRYVPPPPPPAPPRRRRW
jgi:uncharacterized membrane protein